MRQVDGRSQTPRLHPHPYIEYGAGSNPSRIKGEGALGLRGRFRVEGRVARVCVAIKRVREAGDCPGSEGATETAGLHLRSLLDGGTTAEGLHGAKLDWACGGGHGAPCDGNCLRGQGAGYWRDHGRKRSMRNQVIAKGGLLDAGAQRYGAAHQRGLAQVSLSVLAPAQRSPERSRATQARRRTPGWDHGHCNSRHGEGGPEDAVPRGPDTGLPGRRSRSGYRVSAGDQTFSPARRTGLLSQSVGGS